MQIMVREHNMLHRQAIILKAATYPLNDKDRQRLKVTFTLPLLHLASYHLRRPVCTYQGKLPQGVPG